MTIDPITALNDEIEACKSAIDDMVPLGKRRAEAEREYRVKKAERILYEREHNHTPVTIIEDIVRGYPPIATLAYTRDCAEVEEGANREAVLYHKKNIDALREQIAREWSEAGQSWT